MNINFQKEEFSYAYIYAVVAATGYSCQIASRPLDIGGISETELCLRRCGYWLSLKRLPEIQNTESVTISLPRQQLFTINALKNIMQPLERGGTL